MPPADLNAAQETPRDPIEIRAENAITIAAAVQLAHDASLPLGLSTLQRWAKNWYDQVDRSPVKTILVTTRAGKAYTLDKEDFEAWVFEQKQNGRSQEISLGLERPREISRDPKRPVEASQDPDEVPQMKKLESELFQLKIDIGVRNQLLDRAREEMEKIRSAGNELLRENGALQFELRQLKAAPDAQRIGQGSEDLHSVDNSTPPIQ